MKYIIIPILKFIWAVILSLTYGPIVIIFRFIKCLWEWDFSYDNMFEYYLERLSSPFSDGICISPYVYNIYLDNYYKSVYHYIWGYPIKN